MNLDASNSRLTKLSGQVSGLLTRSLLLVLCLAAAVAAQEDPSSSASDDLEAAFDRKIQAKTIGDFDTVVELCKSAIDKGLDAEDEKEAKLLASSALFEHAQQLVARIGRRGNPQLWRREALVRLREATKFNPDQTDAWLMVAQLNMLRDGDLDEAATALDRTIGLAEEEPKKLSQAHFLRSSLLRRSDPEDGRDDLDKAIELDPTNVGARLRRSQILINEGDIEGGIEDSEAITQIDGASDTTFIQQAAFLRDQADAKSRLLAGLNAAQQDDDDDAQSAEELEQAADELFKKSLEFIDSAIGLNQDKHEYLLVKSQTHLMLEQQEEAITAIDGFLDKESSNIDAWLLKAQILQNDESKVEQELECLDKAANLDPYAPRTLDRRRAYFARRGDFEKALQEAKKANESEPNFGSMQNLAILYSITEKPKKAAEIYNTLLSQLPGISQIQNAAPRAAVGQAIGRMDLLRSRADTYLSTGDHADAVDDYEEALELAELIEEIASSISTDAEFSDAIIEGVLNNFSWVLATSDDEDVRDGERAVEYGLRACEASNYKKPHILSTLAAAYAEKEDFKSAIQWAEKGLEVNEEEREKEDADMEAIDSQKESLEKELAFYKQDKPWRENQALEKEKKAEKEKDKKKSQDKDDSDKDDDDADDDDEESEKE